MERIKAALARARAERETISSLDPGLVAAAEGAVVSSGLRRTTPPATEVKVTYKRTSTLPVDAARLRANRIILTQEQDVIADAYKVLRTHVLQRMRTNGWKTLAVTSPMDGNGKTLTAINLAISLAQDVNQTILLVDLDLRRPTLGRYLWESPTRGISDFLTEGTDLGDLLVHPGVERLTILPGNHSFTQSSEMLSSPRMIQLVHELKTRYENRLILFDMPPLLTTDDVLAFLPHLDAVMLVIEDGRTTKDQLDQAYRLLGDKHIIGTVLNKSAEASSAAGYY
jgi:capsular exopolysaccharide synthesis family protein